MLGIFCFIIILGGGGGGGGHVTFHVSQLLGVPGCFSITVIIVSLNCSLVHSVQF